MSFNLADVLKDVSNSDTNREQIECISLSLIDEDPNNFYQLTDIPLLADNISLCGLQQPIRVRQKEDGRYIIVSGHRRRAALEMLVADGYAQWQEAPCIVERDAVPPPLQQLRLILANSNTRKMSSAEISKQDELITKYLYELKEEYGYEFPGRMRDHVAKALGVSKSKLARLKVIREKLAVCWLDSWKNGTIGESVAYNLSQMPESWQTVIHNVWGDKAARLCADTVYQAKEKFQNVAKIQCEHGRMLCEHTVTMMEKNCKEMYYTPCTRCCFDCDSLQTCKNCCPQAESRKKELKAVAKKAQFDAKREQEERDRPGAEFARMVWNRIGKARERSGCSIETLVKARGEYYNEFCDDPNQKKMENGEGDYGPGSTISFGYGINARDMMKVVAVADALKCSVDYLLGRTDDRESHLSNSLLESPVPNSGTFFLTGEPTVAGDYILLMHYPRRPMMVELWEWDGEMWVDGEIIYDPDFHAKIIGWIPMPDTPGMMKAETNESCITGMSPSGHCAAAACCANEYACCLQCPEKCNLRCGWIEEDA